MTEITVSGAASLPNLERVAVRSRDLRRIAQGAGSTPADLPPRNVDLGMVSRHVIIHDVHNVGWWAPVLGGTLYNALVYNTGWWSDDPADSRTRDRIGHGHPLYCQNSGQVDRVIDSCIFGVGFAGTPGKIYAEGTDTVRNVGVFDTIFIGGRFLVGGKRYGANQIHFDCCVFGGETTLQMGYQAVNGTGSVTDCVVERVTVTATQPGHSWRDFAFTGNTLVSRRTASGYRGLAVEVRSFRPEWQWDENTYYLSQPRAFAVFGEDYIDFDQWRRRTGFDRNSTCVIGAPPQPIVRVIGINGGGEHLANVAILHQTAMETVPLDLSGLGLTVGRNYVMRSAIDPENDVRPFTYTGAPVTVRMDGTRATPHNWPADRPLPGYMAQTGYPFFGAFRIEQQPAPVTVESRLHQTEARLAALEKEVSMIRGVLGGAGGIGPVMGLPGGGPGLFVNPSDFSALWIAGQGTFADASMTTPASASGPVKGWRDLTSGARHVTQAGADSLAPTYSAAEAAFNNRPALFFDGGDVLSSGVVSALLGHYTANSGGYTVYVVLAYSATGNRTLLTESLASVNTTYTWLYAVGATANINPNLSGSADAANLTATGLNSGAARLLTLHYSDATGAEIARARVDGVETGSDPGNLRQVTTATSLHIGALVRSSGTSNYFSGHLACIGVVMNAAPSASIESAIAAYYGITLP